MGRHNLTGYFPVNIAKDENIFDNSTSELERHLFPTSGFRSFSSNQQSLERQSFFYYFVSAGNILFSWEIFIFFLAIATFPPEEK